MFTIGIDPHKGSHVAAVLDQREELLAEVRIRADRHQQDRLLRFAEPYAPRVWAVEGARGLGALLAQQLVAAGETVVDVPAKLSARVRVLDNGHADKNDIHDARAAAIVGLRHRNLGVVVAENHASVLRMLAKRHHDLTARRTQAICRLHALLATMTAGGLPRLLSAERAARELRRMRPDDPVGLARRHAALEQLAEVRHADTQLAALRTRIVAAVAVANTTVTDIHGVGPIVAAYLIGYTGDIGRFQGPLRPLQRHRAPQRVVGTEPAAPPQRPREPTTQPRNPRRRGHPDRARHPRTRLLPTQTRRGQDQEGSAPGTEAAHQRRGLAPTPSRPRRTLRNGSGRTPRNDSESSVADSAS